MKKLLYLFFALVLLSCQESVSHRTRLLTQAWMGKPIYYPVDTTFQSFETDSVRHYTLKRKAYTVVTYIDKAACADSLTWKAEAWKDFLDELRQTCAQQATCLFFFNPADKAELEAQLRRESFNFPVCIDEDNCFYKLNRFPQEARFRTFLVDSDNRVVAIGNPAEDEAVRKRYFEIIRSSNCASGRPIG